MRIIAGKLKGMNLYSTSGKTTQPTTSFFREFIFSVYQDLEGKRVLDLYSGTGALGLEALSRGAAHVDFVEMANSALKSLIANLEKTKTTEVCTIYKRNVLTFIKKCEETYDIIIMDPPYDKNLVMKTIDLILEYELLNPGGAILIEHSKRELIDAKYEHLITYANTKKAASLTIIEI